MNTADYRALADLRYQIRCFLNSSERAATAAGLNPQHHQLLLALKGAPPGVETTVTYLAERLQLRHHSLVELIDRLQARGLVRRSRSRSDRRVVLVAATPHGERLLLKLSLHHQQLLRRLGPALVHSLERVIFPSVPSRGSVAPRRSPAPRPASPRRVTSA